MFGGKALKSYCRSEIWNFSLHRQNQEMPQKSVHFSVKFSEILDGLKLAGL
jgi:hypothetical protein